ncbi:MAG: DUF1549 domain-containing protein, partial [Methylococcales bacterium]|nr:DUF1549 domain-containing protein [Methylococcales bacterium]
GSFIPPKKTAIPKASKQVLGIDYFVHARLAEEKLSPAKPADRTTLIRRVSLDLTGLPPSPKEVDTFLKDKSPDAYNNLVERLLKSKHFGEHFARYWLDAARYADSNGYFTDQGRTLWPWRDWVINAYNNNVPFDQFTIEQLAGDLMPNSTQAQKIASGFNRNHMVNNETGIVQEEYRVEYVADRIKTTGTVWMGLTVGCARCHDHKFDPISQRDFYSMFAFFNNVPEAGLAGSKGNAAPLMRIPTPEQTAELASLDKELADAKKAFIEVDKSIKKSQSEWEKNAVKATIPAPTKGLIAHFPLDKSSKALINIPEKISFTPGVLGGSAKFSSGHPIETPIDLPIDSDKPFSLGIWMHPNKGAGCILSKTDDSNAFRGFDL